MLGSAGSGYTKFGSISGMLLGQISAGRLGFQKAFGTGRRAGLGNTVERATDLCFLFFPVACQALTFQFATFRQPVLWVCPLPCLPDPPRLLRTSPLLLGFACGIILAVCSIILPVHLEIYCCLCSVG